jgi:hypothetical protein
MLSMNEELFIAICGLAVVVLFALALYFLSREDKEEQRELSSESEKDLETLFTEDTKTPSRINSQKLVHEAMSDVISGFNKTRTGNSGGAEIIPINFEHKPTWEFDPYKPRENFQAGYSASVTKKEKGKKTTWGCSICPEKTYQHATSAYKHLRNKHR